MDDVSKNEGRTVLYVSHNMNTIRQLCTRCVVLDHGKVIFDGDVEEAIGIYLGIDNDSNLQCTFDSAYHTCKKSVETFSIDAMKIINRDAPIGMPGDILEVILSCSSSKEWNDVRFRFEWHFHDGQTVGTMLSNNTVSYLPNETTDTLLQVDLSHFAPGKYSADIIAYIQNDLGTELFLDGVYPGLRIEITETGKDRNYVTWLHNHWGHVRLHNIRMVNNQNR
jgi:lipopolysaccharide transport system ATP-binding protein